MKISSQPFSKSFYEQGKNDTFIKKYIFKEHQSNNRFKCKTHHFMVCKTNNYI